MIFLDTETCGLTGPIVLIQYADEESNVTLHEVWRTPVKKTLRLLEKFCDGNVCAFNLSFDWFHVNKLYNLLQSIEERTKPPVISDVAKSCNRLSTTFCLKPKKCLDLYAYTRKTEWQCLMDRRDIRIRKVPLRVAHYVAECLEKKLPLSKILFYRRQDGYKWQVEVSKDNPDLCDVVLKFGATSKLKPLCAEIFKCQTVDYPVPKSFYPEEHSYNPYTTEWTKVIDKHIKFWANNKTARGYAEQDVILLKRLWIHWDKPEPGDDDSELTACVGACRWRGYNIDINGIENRLRKNYEIIAQVPQDININSPADIKEALRLVCSQIETLVVKNTEAKTLKLLMKNYKDRPVGKLAKVIYAARQAIKENETLERLRDTGSFNPEFKVVGTLSGRMSGGSEVGSMGGSINPQGIKRDRSYRALFKLRDDRTTERSFILNGGDFKSFEVTICHAACKDPNLEHDLRSGKSFHGTLGTILYDLPYEDILQTRNGVRDQYSAAKSTAFAYMYGANVPKLATTAGIDEAKMEQSLSQLAKKYTYLAAFRQTIFDRFCSMRQPNGIGTLIMWNEPAGYVESLLGYRRYFTLENRIVKTLFELAQNPPEGFNMQGIVIRRDRQQTIKGASQSALFCAAFQIQASNMRAAFNHIIQSTGAGITKRVQRKIWDLQPSGVHGWAVQPFNMHDEILTVCTSEETSEKVKEIVEETVKEFKSIVPLLEIDWKSNLKDWSDVK